jgi:ATP-dependent RNA helicase HelY
MTSFGFELDRFQLEAISALDRGHNVLVAAPTGSGKTVVAEAAIDLGLASGGKIFYTTPIKALSNQKFNDLRSRLGNERVGLLTGDNAINGDAPVVVMTTEVLRNMIYAQSATLDGLHYVILDEVHYLQDAYRGAVWEEVIIHLPAAVRLVCLSATVSNAEELGRWLSTVRGRTETVIETERPVELTVHYLVGDRAAEQDTLLDVLVDGQPNPDGRQYSEDPRLAQRRGRHGRPQRRFSTPRRIETVQRLADEHLLPAIYFIFSRRACDEAMGLLRDAGVRFTTSEERREIRALVEQHVVGLSDADLGLLDYDLWLQALEQGIAAHHAGMVPPMKEAVEACFVRGLVKVVFATETLALGINMPARSVVVEKLTKFNGEGHELLTPSQFTQLTGRAGRRGIDDEGHAVVLWSPFVPFDTVAELAASRRFPLQSSFRPTYNMAANLIMRFDREHAHAVLGLSFAQYQADAAVVGLQKRFNDQRDRRDQAAELVVCELGDVAAWAARRAKAERGRRQRRQNDARAVEHSLQHLRPGDVVAYAEFPAAVIAVAHRGRGTVKVTLVADHVVHHVTAADLSAPLHAVGVVELPEPYAPQDREFRDAVGDLIAAYPLNRAGRRAVAATERATADGAGEDDPVAGCPDLERHLQALAELESADREMEVLEKSLDRRQGSVVRRFEQVVALLVSWDMVADWTLTRRGRMLASLYHESDLLIADCAERGLFDGLDTGELAGLVSCFTYEERRQHPPRYPRLPSETTALRFDRVGERWNALVRAERGRGLPQTRVPDAGFALAASNWARGRSLESVLDDDVTAGDFVRNVRILIDLLGQLGQVAPSADTRATAHAAAGDLARGIVSASTEISAVAP